MKRVVALGLAAVLIGAGVWLFLDQSARERDDGPGDSVAPSPTPPLPSAEVEPSAVVTRPTAIRTTPFIEDPADSATAPFIVSGRAVDYEARPLPRVKVRLQMYEGFEAKGALLFEKVETSDAAGAFGFGMRKPDRTVTVAATVVEDDYSSARASETVIRGDPPPPLIIVRAGRFNAEVTGTVSDKSGGRIAGASVGWGREVKTDSAGAYRFRFLVRGTGAVSIAAQAPGFARKESQLAAARPGSTTRMDFVLQPAGVVVGTVRSRDGAPLQGAKVWAYTGERVETSTDPSGSFRLAGFDTERDHQLIKAEADGFLPTLVQNVTFTAGEARIEIVLDPGAEVRGVVIGREDAPVEGAEVRSGKPNYADAITVRTDAAGKFRFPALKPGVQKLAANRRGYAETVASVTVPEPGGGVAPEVQIRLEKGLAVSGVVADAAGTPIGGISISIKIAGDYAGFRGIMTGADGRFAIDSLPAANVSLELWGAGYLRLLFPIREYRDDLKIVMERTARLAGRVIDATTRAPIARFTIRIVPPDMKPGERVGYGYSTTWFNAGHEFVDTDGYWSVDGEDLSSGALYAVEASATGYAAAKAPRITASTDPARDAVVLELRAAASMAGIAVVEDTAAPVVDATVSAVTPEDEKARETHSGWKPRVTAKTDASGAFLLEGVSGGTVHLFAEHADYPPLRVGPFELAEGERKVGIKIAFGRGTTIEGTCVGLDGKGAAGASISLEARPRLGKRRTATTDDAGRFTFRGVGSGPHYASGRYRGDPFDSFVQVVIVESVEKQTINVPTLGTGTLRVEVEADEAIPEGLLLRLQPTSVERARPGDDLRPSRYASMPGKAIELSGIVPGHYEVSIQQMTMAGTSPLQGKADVTLADGERGQLKIVLKRGQ